MVDGCSADGTADIARRSLGRWGFASTAVIPNERRTTSSNLNVGLAKAAGEIICRVDARTRIEPHYVRTCVDILQRRSEVAVVGGAQVAIARDPRALSVGIARALNNRWSMGGSRYRRSTVSGTADTVYLGAFRRVDLVDEGGWDEHLGTNQDFDLNRRMAQRGHVWFEASLRSGYLPRPSLVELWRQYRRFGRAKVRYWQQAGDRPQPRQWLLLAGPPAVTIAALAVVMAAPSTTKGLAGVGAAGISGAALIEARGAAEPSAGIAAHACGVAAIGVVGGGWWSGVVSQIAERLTGRA